MVDSSHLEAFDLLFWQLLLTQDNPPESLIHCHISADINKGFDIITKINLPLLLVALFLLLFDGPFNKERIPLFQLSDDFFKEIALPLQC